jgi:hypothetical protein
MSRYAAYIDESGNHDLATEKNGASDYFLILAVIVNQADVPALEAQVERIREGFFGNGEMKSNRLKAGRRLQIFEALAPLQFKFYAVAVDKSRVDKDSGLGYKKSFIKFTNGLLYKALFQNLIDLTIYADAHGGTEFIESFKRYLETNHKPDLFSQTNIEIVDSKDDVLVQLADFLVGTAAKIYEGKAAADVRAVFLDFLKTKRIRIDEWPPRFEVQHPVAQSSSELDGTVCSISLQAAARFLAEDPADGDVDVQIQHALLSYLLFRARFPTDGDFVLTQEIIDHLHAHGFSDVTKHYLRSKVISKLRDRDVVIASSPRGYKIPTSYADIVGFAELVDGIVSPLLERLKRANAVFGLGSAGQINFLSEGRFTKLRLMVGLESELPPSGAG